MTDQELINEIRTGNIASSQKAMRHLYKTFYPMTKNMVCKYNGNTADAQDVFQDSVIIVYNKIKQADFTVTSKLSSYMYSVSKNLWFKHLRDNKKSSNNLDISGLQIDSFERIDESLEFTDRQVMLGKLLMESGKKCFDLLKAFYFEKLRVKKIVELHNYSSDQIVRTQKLRCIKKIRVLMESTIEYNELRS
ncbi:MAG: RNA polymerase sigma factor (sigma-70 family) [Saprospiraceae bacterium]|jgi:RNA polymerase sigma factor (sigma-70 family)